MSALDDFNKILEKTQIMQQVFRSIQDEPQKLLCDICSKQAKTGRPVPDFNLHMQGYIGDIALKALIEANLIKRVDGGRVSLYCYEPTEEGLKYYNFLKEGSKS